MAPVSDTSFDPDNLPTSERPAQRTPGRVKVRDNARAGRFEAVRDGEVVGITTYERRRGRIELVHTVTDPVHRGQGIASVLARTALRESRAAGLRIQIVCPFIESWLQRHPEERGGGVAPD